MVEDCRAVLVDREMIDIYGRKRKHVNVRSGAVLQKKYIL